MKTAEQIKAELEALTTRSNEILAEAEAGTKSLDEAKAAIGEIQPQLDVLTREREERIREEEVKSLKGTVTNLQAVMEDLRKGPELPGVGSAEEKALEDTDPYKDGQFSVFNDMRMANKGDAKARERLTHGYEEVRFDGKALSSEGKAMSEGVAAQGGYLVRPQVERQIVQARELDNVLRGLCSKLNVTTNSIQLDQLGLTTTAGWVDELLQKPEGTGMTLATVTASVFTAAGLATISNQLLADSNPAVDGLVTADLAKRLIALEETAFLNGNGTGKPLGVLNTPGIGATPLTSVAIIDLLDGILDAIAAVETSHGAPNAILMHPRTWTRILKSRDAQGAFYIDPNGGPQDPRTGLRGPTKSLWGYPVQTTNRMPTNLGTGVNESRVIVGDFREALILDRQGLTVDESRHVFFTTNQTVFRAEQRVGFTAARTPLAFNVVGGVGLANG